MNNVCSLDTSTSIWEHFFTVAPLIVIGSKEAEGYDLAPKHMTTPLGFGNYFAFVCTPKHSTYNNIRRHKEFTVSFPKPDQVVLTALSATPRCEEFSKTKGIVSALPTVKAPHVDALLVANSYLYFECKLFKIVDGFDQYSLIIGYINNAYVDKSYKKFSEVDEQKQIKDNPLLAYLAYGRFAKITETFNFPFPKNFKR